MYYENESVDHLLFTCGQFYDLRQRLWGNVIASSPSPSMTAQSKPMAIDNKTVFILSVLHNTYVPEWMEFY